MSASTSEHRVRGVDHAAFPTFDPVGTVNFYNGVLKFPIVHSICAAGWGPENHPDFIHFFFDIGNGDRMAFFYYFGLEPFGDQTAPGDSWARLPRARPSSSRTPATSPSTWTGRRTCWSTAAASTPRTGRARCR